MSHPPARIGNWWLEKNLGAGVSGSIYRAQHIYNGEKAAIKIQPQDIDCPTNTYERGFYPLLQGGRGMPTLWDHGVQGHWDYIVIDLLGPSLDSIFRHSSKPVMDLRSVCCIARQMIERLDFMHSRGVLHRDIQLGNCTVGLPPNDNIIYMIDFGFSKRYIDPHTNRHIPDSKKKRDFIGNYWFSSVNVHCKGKVPSRRDDMEALALMLIHLLTPHGLPWTRNGVPRTDEHRDRIIREKMDTTPEMLCDGLPTEFEEFLRYCRRLKFLDCPDYDMWRAEFEALTENEGFPHSDDFVWPPPAPVYKSPTKTKSPGGRSDADLDDVLGKLAGLNMGHHEVNGTPLKPKPLQKKSTNVIVITDSNNSDSMDKMSKDRALTRYSKAVQLNKLVCKVGGATDNKMLAELVADFIAVIQSNTSRVVTLEGFAFLEALQKQLADPSVFVMASTAGSEGRRTRRGNSNKENPPEAMAKQAKMNRLAALKGKALTADSNSALAQQVSEFEELTRKSAGHTLTRGGVTFLETLAGRLQQIS